MNDSQNELIRYRLARAEETLAEARLLAQGYHWNAAVSRLYYACFTQFWHCSPKAVYHLQNIQGSDHYSLFISTKIRQKMQMTGNKQRNNQKIWTVRSEFQGEKNEDQTIAY